LRPTAQDVCKAMDITTEVMGEVVDLDPMIENGARDLISGLLGANGADVAPFGTEAGLFQQTGMDVIVCGPGSIEQAHKADEFIRFDQLQQCVGMLERLGQRLI